MVTDRPHRWANQHPFLLALLVLLLVVIPGLIRAQQLTENVQAQADRNTALATCLVEYADALSDALQDRDVVNRTARAASLELWAAIHGYLTSPPTTGIRPLLRAITRYETILHRVDRAAVINPYPTIRSCLPGPEAAELQANFKLRHDLEFELVAATVAAYDTNCFSRKVTIRGTKGDDVIHGTDGPDVIFAYSGDDLILTGKGNDRICARRGDDTINAGQDKDWVGCGPGTDFALQAEFTWACE